MSKRKYNNILILALFAFYIIYYKIFISASKLEYSEFINVAVIAIISFIAVLLLGYRKDRINDTKKSILKTVLTDIVIFLIVSYALGTVTGFTTNENNYELSMIIKNIFAPICYIGVIELFRYVTVNANSDKKITVYLITAVIILLELAMNLNGVLMYNFETTFRAISMIVLPIIIKNATLSYLAIYGGLKSTILYRLILDLYAYILPAIPNLGDYITSVIGVLLPTMVYIHSSRIVDNANSIEILDAEDDKKSKKKINISDIIVTIIIILLVGLISGYFKFAIIGVGSGSMSPEIEKGDAVVYKKIKNKEELKVNDILVFQSGNKIVIHRLVEIKNSGGKTYYITKGDANNGRDGLNLTLKNIKGKVMFKIKYLAYPNLFLKDLADKE